MLPILVMMLVTLEDDAMEGVDDSAWVSVVGNGVGGGRDALL